MKRVSEENKKLSEMLSIMCENYNALRNQLDDYMTKTNNNIINIKESKKRKSESSYNNMNGVNPHNINVSESSSTDEEQSSKKIAREESVKAKISRVHYRTEPSDTSLVRITTTYISCIVYTMFGVLIVLFLYRL